MSKLTISEAMDSLTGFDEIAIEKHLDFDPYTQGEAKPVLLVRSLVFVAKRREGLTDVEARKAVLEMPVSEVNDFFADDPEEIDPDDPETPEGKDEQEPADGHES